MPFLFLLLRHKDKKDYTQADNKRTGEDVKVEFPKNRNETNGGSRLLRQAIFIRGKRKKMEKGENGNQIETKRKIDRGSKDDKGDKGSKGIKGSTGVKGSKGAESPEKVKGSKKDKAGKGSLKNIINKVLSY